MALTRVTPTGWLEETGSVTRVTPTGWVQETQASGGPTYTLAISVGSFSITGNGLTESASRKLVVAVGSFTLSGNATQINAARKLAANAGAYNLTGKDVSLTYTPASITYSLSVGAGSFTVSCNDVSMLASRKLIAGFGSYTVSGKDIGFGESLPVVEEERRQVGSVSKSSKGRVRKIIIEQINDVEDFVEKIQEHVKEEPKLKPALRKAKRIKPEKVENTETNTQAWINYYSHVADALRDKQKADELKKAIDDYAIMLRMLLRQNELKELLAIEQKRIAEEEEMLILLMVA